VKAIRKFLYAIGKKSSHIAAMGTIRALEYGASLAVG
jgi:hypothetical protein